MAGAFGHALERALVFQALGEAREAGQPGLAGAGDPLREVLAGEVGERGGEGADLAAGGPEFGAAFQDDLEAGFLVFGQGVRAAAEPVRDVADGRRAGGSGSRAVRFRAR